VSCLAAAAARTCLPVRVF